MKKAKKIMSLFMVAAMVLGVAPIKAQAKEPEALPEQLEAPKIILYDNGSRYTNLEVKAEAPESAIDFYEKSRNNIYYADENGGDTNNYYAWSDYGENVLSGMYIQLDYKVDDGNWHYTSEWDTSVYDTPASSFDGKYATTVQLAYISQYSSAGSVGRELIELGAVKETTDGSSTYYRFDQEGYMITVRARFYAVLRDHDYNQTIIFSPWSATTSLGKGEKDVSTVPTDLGQSTIKNLRIVPEDEYYGAPVAKFDILPDKKVVEAMQWSEQYDEDLEYSELYLVVETSLDEDFGEGSVIHKYRIYESASLRRWQTYDAIFYDLWQELPDKDQSAFNWNGETIYVRTKYLNVREVDGNESSIESAYSNTLSLTGKVTKKYDITITHEEYGFDKDGYYSESYSKTEGLSLNGVECSPLEGCYVEKVVVNDVVKYDKEDESTYELLNWYYGDTYFNFIGDENIASQDLDIVITYGGTPTMKYGITTECGTGGNLYIYDSYVSWDDNSLVVYHGSTPKIEIEPYGGFVIDKVLVDGVENEDAKVNGYYEFDSIEDSTHSISATFKRVAYEVYSWVYHGTIETDYPEYTSGNQYVAIGDDITFTFAPLQDNAGNYYEIEKVYIDWVLNEDAKNSGTYTFENVQAEHSIYVYYSDEPVITHDITATSGEHGHISPEGVIHAREGSTRRFDFVPDEGYEVDKVFVDDVEITNLATKVYYNIADVREEHTIHVTFKKLPVQYEVNVISSGNNPIVHTVNPAGATPVWEGEGFSLNYSPFVGYEVEKVLVNDVEVEKTGTYEIASVNQNYTIEIFFKIKSYTVTFVDYDNRVLKTEKVEHGAKATAPEVTAREHYVFVGWDSDYNDVTTNVTIKAMYEPAEYEVKFIGWEGTVLKTEMVEYTQNATAPEAPERTGYDFSHWSVDYTNVSCDLEVTAVYTPKEYSVQFVDSDGTVISGQTVKYGEAAVVPDDPEKEGYTFVGWDIAGYGYVTSNMIITAQYVEGVKNIYTVTASAYGNYGVVSPAGVTQVLEGSSLKLDFHPDELSKIVRVVVDGAEVILSNSYEFENVTANHTVEVYFAPTATIYVHTEEVENGTVNGHYELVDGKMVYVLDVTPDEGYELSGIYINGDKVEAELVDGRYIIRDLSDDMEVNVFFEKIEVGAKDDGKTDVSDKNEDSGNDGQSPTTGDHNVIFAWMALMVLALAMASLVKKRTR